MKVKVIKKFIDKTTGKMRNIDDVFTCSEKRFNEICKAGTYVEKVDEKSVKADEKSAE